MCANSKKGRKLTACSHEAEHNHPIKEDHRAYAMHHKLSPEAMALVVKHLENNDDVFTIFNSLKINGYTNIVRHDIANIKQHFGKLEKGKEMFDFITTLQDLDFHVRMSETVIIDATYKTNSHQMTYVNIVGTSNVSGNPRTTLKTCLRDAVWPDDNNNNNSNSSNNTKTILLPDVFITDNEKALRKAITQVFSESKQLLCYKHIKDSFKKQLLLMMKGDESSKKRDLLDKLSEFLDRIALKCITHQEVKKKTNRYLEFAKKNCKDQGKAAGAFFEKKMKDKENWVNMYVYKHAHFGNCTSNHAESAHASLKHSLGTSLGKLKTVTLKVKKWYDKLVADRKHWLMVKSLGEGTKIVFDKVNAARLNDIRLKSKRANALYNITTCFLVTTHLPNSISSQSPASQDAREKTI
ncbi:hypothetical protein PHYBLDRAFT_142260 [Phycomyces blakesleeanus NRRL 1555(-)]|uniref:MULE transposase domain-containing protein n=1 Tax=Phycomyces blakesleeanus (strain ATCC 8743b / DSM 1359 / FGSC 10004 / NBRC 33097 / NRRL 1555) TaxID=763407 RepID=A0A167NWJ0_PHYB8|nr:hypothetical protein PHYBLDRAFT_142260 [Phycomyces blakesleeanus NRRL 1555(-)]OAD76751.1 hypothetical protein PHYBLDRAFT_142260 [Phycomyces blakesleeanus NRRL 1555(-)]|eukprot:XP_018294791.1 hypothetical protein PHYBLDRAFT_142260 [Phycomyces blakesleeanus NRRL 1555(-)]